MRLLFLCNNYHPLSVACLEALHAAARFDITLGLARPSKNGLASFARTTWRRYGLTETLRRGRLFAVAAARLKARQCGLRIAGYRTVREFLNVHPLPHLEFDNINRIETVSDLRARGFDLFVAGAFSQILGPEVLVLPARGALNVHLSLLPKYRGPSACYWVVKNREPKTGVTIHFMEPRIDAGDIVAQRETPLHPGETPAALEHRLAPLAAELLLETLDQLKAGTLKRTPQTHEQSSYYSFPNAPISD